MATINKGAFSLTNIHEENRQTWSDSDSNLSLGDIKAQHKTQDIKNLLNTLENYLTKNMVQKDSITIENK